MGLLRGLLGADGRPRAERRVRAPPPIEPIVAIVAPPAPIVEVPEAQHHVMLDQPLAFVAALRMLLENWIRAEAD